MAKMMALTTAAVDSGAPIPEKRDLNPPAVVEEVLPEEVWRRTLMVSKGCPTTTEAEPAMPPATRSCRADILFSLLEVDCSSVILLDFFFQWCFRLKNYFN